MGSELLAIRHPGRKYKDVYQLVNDTMKNIAFEGEHTKGDRRTILGKNGIFISWGADGRIITALRNKSGKSAWKYYEDNTIKTHYDSLKEAGSGVEKMLRAVKKWLKI